MFGERLFEARKRKGITQTKAAESASITQARYSAYETNRQQPPVDVAARLASSLGVSLDWLCGNDNTARVENVGDVAQSIIDISNVCEVCFDETSNGVCIEIGHQQELQEFISKYENLRSMQENEATKEVFAAWVNAEIQKLSTIPLKKGETNGEA